LLSIGLWPKQGFEVFENYPHGKGGKGVFITGLEDSTVVGAISSVPRLPGTMHLNNHDKK
jgi:hypothetical protein